MSKFLSLILLLSFALFSFQEVTKFPYTIEGEDLLEDSGQKTKLWKDIWTQEVPGYSGEGFCYLTGQSVSFEVTVEKDSMFKVTVRGVQIISKDPIQQTIVVNGIEYVNFAKYADEWTDYDFGLIRLNKGANTIKIIHKYGWMAIDKITLDYPVWPDFKEASSEPCDKKATDSAKKVMKYLHSIYGEHILSGQQEIYGSGHNNNYEYEFDYLEELTGKLPAIRAFDIANVNNMYGWDDGCFDRAIDWWENKGGLLSASYHLTVPTDWDNYEVGEKIAWSASAVTYKPLKAFSVKNASVKGTKENDWINANLELVAKKFLELQDRGISVIWRPLHEAEGNPGIGNAWFWWGQEGPEPFKALWKYYFTELTETYGVHNLIWELNLYCWNDDSALWYPGDDYVDIVGYDKYNVVYNRHDGKTSGPNLDAESRLFYGLLDIVKNKKMVSMPENDSVPSLSNMVTENVPWLYFCIWYDDEGANNFVSGPEWQDAKSLAEIYKSDFCITLDELPDFRS